MVSDEVFVATMTKNGGSFTVTSGGNSVVTNTAGPGVQVFRIPMGVGEQKFSFTTGGGSGDDTASIPISADCWVSPLLPPFLCSSFRLGRCDWGVDADMGRTGYTTLTTTLDLSNFDPAQRLDESGEW